MKIYLRGHMIMNWTIREAEEKDIPKILDLYATYILNSTYTFEYDIPSTDSFKGRFKKITGQFPWIVCEADGVLAGYAYASQAFERAAYQWDADVTVYLHESFQRKGIATALYGCLTDLVKLQGYYTLYAVITASNEPSVFFHRALGFQDIGFFHKTGYKSGEWLDVLWMEKAIRSFDGEPVPPAAYKSLDRKAVSAVFQAHSL